MKGKKVAATLGQCNQLLLEKALEKAGLTDKDIELVNMNPDDAGAAFAAGKLDVAVTWEPWITKVSGEKKGHVIFSSKETPNLILDVLAISAKTAKTKAAETKAFLKALNRGYEFVQKSTRRSRRDRREGAGAEARRGQGHAAEGQSLQRQEEPRGARRAGGESLGAGRSVLQGQEGQRHAGGRRPIYDASLPQVSATGMRASLAEVATNPEVTSPWD